MAGPYASLSAEDAEQLKREGEQTLLNFGTSFHPELVTSATGSYIATSSGHRILDWTSGQISCLIGHGNPEIVKTITEHAESLDHLFSPMVSSLVVNLAKRLTSLLPEGLDKALFLSTGQCAQRTIEASNDLLTVSVGPESNEAAIRLAKLYTGKFEIIGLRSGWHGMTSDANAATYHSRGPGYGPMTPGSFMFASPNAYRSIFRNADGSHDWRTELDYGFSLIDQQTVGSLAAVIVEPILSSAGMHPLPHGYLKVLKRHCELRNMLLIVDEAQTAIGRSGDMFGFQHDGDGVVPDMAALGMSVDGA